MIAQQVAAPSDSGSFVLTPATAPPLTLIPHAPVVIELGPKVRSRIETLMENLPPEPDGVASLGALGARLMGQWMSETDEAAE